MAQTLHCFEPAARPTRASLGVDPGERFAVHVLSDGRHEAARGLRATVLRRAGQPPPPGSFLLLEAEIRAARAGDPPNFRARRLHPRVDVEVLRPDVRSRLVINQEWRSGTRLEATLPDLSTLSFTLEMAAEAAQGPRASAAGRPSKREAAAGVGALLWMIPTAAATLADPKARAAAWLQSRLKRAGVSPALLSPMLVVLAMGAGLGTVAFLQYRGKQDAEARAAAAEEGRAAAEAGRDAALVAESACMEGRRELAKTLDDRQTQARLQAELVLAASLSRSVAVELGGPRMGTPEALAFDTTAAPRALDQVVLDMVKLRDPPTGADRCLGLAEILGQDLPLYVLLWHPDPALVCARDYHVVLGGVDRAGAWGISSRAAEAFGPPEDAGDGEPRSNDRWSAHTLATGLRAVEAALIGADTGPRPPVAPGQGQLWALAVWDAYNRMPASAEGVSDAPMEQCVAELVAGVAEARGPAAPGEPVLPDITAVARGEAVAVAPTAACPWPADALTSGASAAFRAVAHLGNLGLAAGK